MLFYNYYANNEKHGKKLEYGKTKKPNSKINYILLLLLVFLAFLAVLFKENLVIGGKVAYFMAKIKLEERREVENSTSLQGQTKKYKCYIWAYDDPDGAATGLVADEERRKAIR